MTMMFPPAATVTIRPKSDDQIACWYHGMMYSLLSSISVKFIESWSRTSSFPKKAVGPGESSDKSSSAMVVKIKLQDCRTLFAHFGVMDCTRTFGNECEQLCNSLRTALRSARSGRAELLSLRALWRACMSLTGATQDPHDGEDRSTATAAIGSKDHDNIISCSCYSSLSGTVKNKEGLH